MDLRQFRILVAAALVDGSLQPEEEDLLAEGAGRLGLDPGQVAKLLEEFPTHTKEELQALFQALPDVERQQLFQDAVAMVAADRRMYPKETAFLRRLGLAFGFEPRAIGRKILGSEPPRP